MLLVEHYITLWNNDELMEYMDDIWTILQFSYAPIGGIAGCPTPEKLLSKGPIGAKLVRKGDKIIACSIFKICEGSRKLVAGGCDGTQAGKDALREIFREDIKQIERGSWSEVSGGVENMMMWKNKGTPIPNVVSQQILADMGKQVISLDPDGFHYTRQIGGKVYRKILVGNVLEKYRGFISTSKEDWLQTHDRLSQDYYQHVDKPVKPNKERK